MEFSKESRGCQRKESSPGGEQRKTVRGRSPVGGTWSSVMNHYGRVGLAGRAAFEVPITVLCRAEDSGSSLI